MNFTKLTKILLNKLRWNIFFAFRQKMIKNRK
jgi:hypothetical protein